MQPTPAHSNSMTATMSWRDRLQALNAATERVRAKSKQLHELISTLEVTLDEDGDRRGSIRPLAPSNHTAVSAHASAMHAPVASASSAAQPFGTQNQSSVLEHIRAVQQWLANVSLSLKQGRTEELTAALPALQQIRQSAAELAPTSAASQLPIASANQIATVPAAATKAPSVTHIPGTIQSLNSSGAQIIHAVPVPAGVQFKNGVWLQTSAADAVADETVDDLDAIEDFGDAKKSSAPGAASVQSTPAQRPPPQHHRATDLDSSRGSMDMADIGDDDDVEARIAAVADKSTSSPAGDEEDDVFADIEDPVIDVEQEQALLKQPTTVAGDTQRPGTITQFRLHKSTSATTAGVLHGRSDSSVSDDGSVYVDSQLAAQIDRPTPKSTPAKPRGKQSAQKQEATAKRPRPSDAQQQLSTPSQQSQATVDEFAELDAISDDEPSTPQPSLSHPANNSQSALLAKHAAAGLVHNLHGVYQNSAKKQPSSQQHRASDDEVDDIDGLDDVADTRTVSLHRQLSSSKAAQINRPDNLDDLGVDDGDGGQHGDVDAHESMLTTASPTSKSTSRSLSFSSMSSGGSGRAQENRGQYRGELSEDELDEIEDDDMSAKDVAAFAATPVKPAQLTKDIASTQIHEFVVSDAVKADWLAIEQQHRQFLDSVQLETLPVLRQPADRAWLQQFVADFGNSLSADEQRQYRSIAAELGAGPESADQVTQEKSSEHAATQPPVAAAATASAATVNAKSSKPAAQQPQQQQRQAQTQQNQQQQPQQQQPAHQRQQSANGTKPPHNRVTSNGNGSSAAAGKQATGQKWKPKK